MSPFFICSLSSHHSFAVICYRLFWADAHLNEVGFMDLNGGARHHIPAKRTSHISSMTVFDDYLFWSDWNLREIIRADKWTGMNETVLKITTQLPNDIRVITLSFNFGFLFHQVM